MHWDVAHRVTIWADKFISNCYIYLLFVRRVKAASLDIYHLNQLYLYSCTELKLTKKELMNIKRDIHKIDSRAEQILYYMEKKWYDIIYGLKIPNSRFMHNLSNKLNHENNTVNKHIDPALNTSCYINNWNYAWSMHLLKHLIITLSYEINSQSNQCAKEGSSKDFAFNTTSALIFLNKISIKQTIILLLMYI